jgi:hypothetical protein
MSAPWNRRPEFTPADELQPLYPVSIGKDRNRHKADVLAIILTLIFVASIIGFCYEMGW